MIEIVSPIVGCYEIGERLIMESLEARKADRATRAQRNAEAEGREPTEAALAHSEAAGNAPEGPDPIFENAEQKNGAGEAGTGEGNSGEKPAATAWSPNA